MLEAEMTDRVEETIEEGDADFLQLPRQHHRHLNRQRGSGRSAVA
jgi:hypothetical protein